jgi:nucleotide-binding universal stress UspA family protein
VVVGADGSDNSRRAVQWAAAEAQLRRAELRIVHALPFGVPRSGAPDPHLEAATRDLADLAAHARRAGSQVLLVTTDVADGVPVKVLIEESRNCALLVMGSRGQGGLTNLLLGSTAVEVTARAACPVVVIPRDTEVEHGSGAVVVGVDGSPGCEPALEFAFARADQRKARLVAVHVHQAVDAGESKALLADATAPWEDRFPEVIVERRSFPGQVVTELAAASREAEVVVVGGTGRSVVAGVFLGSTGQGLLRHAVVPIVIARRP